MNYEEVRSAAISFAIWILSDLIVDYSLLPSRGSTLIPGVIVAETVND